MRKKWITGFVSVLLVLAVGFTSCSDTINNHNFVGELIPGRYEVLADGFYRNTRFTIFVTVDDRNIIDIEWEGAEAAQTDDHGMLALPFLRNRVLEHQTVQVDGVAGATQTSVSFLFAVREALYRAGAPARMFAAPELRFESETIDILVMGSGVAGLTAAIKAQTQRPDANVVLIEKMDFPGGSTIMSAQIFNLPADDADRVPLQEYAYMKTRGQAVRAMINHWVNNASEVYAFLLNRDSTWAPSFRIPGGGTSIVQNRMTIFNVDSPDGLGVVETLLPRAERLGVRVMLGVEGTALIENNGTVVGAVARDRRWNIEYTFTTRAGVILATGGFGHNIDLRRESLPAHMVNDISLVSGGHQGSGILMARALSGGPADTLMEGRGLIGMGTPHRDAWTFLTGFVVANNGAINPFLGDDNESPAGTVTNYAGAPATGLAAMSYARFRNDYPITARWVNEHRLTNPTARFWALTRPDSLSAPDLYNILHGRAFVADSAAALAPMIGMTVEHLEAAFDAAENAPVDADVDIGDGDFFVATSYVSADIGTIGGIMIDTYARVLRAGTAIPGLYAAGEVAFPQLMFREYVGSGTALTMAAVFGWSAGSHAATRVPSN